MRTLLDGIGAFAAVCGPIFGPLFIGMWIADRRDAGPSS